jgi:hypothetical protein
MNNSAGLSHVALRNMSDIWNFKNIEQQSIKIYSKYINNSWNTALSLPPQVHHGCTTWEVLILQLWQSWENDTQQMSWQRSTSEKNSIHRVQHLACSNGYCLHCMVVSSSVGEWLQCCPTLPALLLVHRTIYPWSVKEDLVLPGISTLKCIRIACQLKVAHKKVLFLENLVRCTSTKQYVKDFF